jgi:hypothetical protein
MLQRQFRAEASARKIAPIRAGTLPCPVYTGTNLPRALIVRTELRDREKDASAACRLDCDARLCVLECACV